MLFYTVAAVTTQFRRVPSVQVLVALVGLVGCFFLGTPKNEEEWREFGGLIMVAIGHGLLYFRSNAAAVSS